MTAVDEPEGFFGSGEEATAIALLRAGRFLSREQR